MVEYELNAVMGSSGLILIFSKQAFILQVRHI